jgi:TonB family protein
MKILNHALQRICVSAISILVITPGQSTIGTALHNGTDTIRRFYDRNNYPTVADHAVFFTAVIFKDSLWCESKYYRFHETLCSFGRYKDSLCKIPVDTFFYFHNDGSLEAIGKYVEGKRGGNWLRFHSNGMLADSCTYSNGNPVNSSLSWDTTGALTDSVSWSDYFGNGFIWKGDGSFLATGQYNLSREKHGSWKYYYPEGKVSTSEIYQRDSLISVKYFEENGSPASSEESLIKATREAQYPGGSAAWFKYLTKSLRYPNNAAHDHIQGTVTVKFVVDETGKVNQAKADFGPKELQGEAIRVIQNSGNWMPGHFHGMNAKSYKIQSIVFGLEKWKSIDL